jgi:TRAP transporter TAXI family solute receptor
MKKRNFIKMGISSLIALGILTSTQSNAAEDKRAYILATASTGGTYYPVGVALATLAKVKLEPASKYGKMTVSAISSGGSGANIKLLRDGEAQLAILQGLYGKWAATGTGKMTEAGKQPYLRSISMLWQNVEHMVVLNEFVNTGDLSDLSGLYGEKFGIGRKNSGTRGSGEEILGNLGIDFSQYTYVHKGYGGTSDAMQNGQISGMNIPAGVPVGAITSIFAKMGDKITVLDATDDQIGQANNGGSLWTRYVISEGTYPGQTKAINTMAQPNFLATHADINEEDIYQLTKTIYENLEFLGAIHKATKVMDIQKAIVGLPVPLHPGAVRYYKEQGISIPDSLLAN